MSDENIKCTDSNGKLNLYNYTECDNNSSPEIKMCRGVIKDLEENIVVQTFGYTDEYVTNDVDIIKDRLKNIEDWEIRYSLEGTLLRIFYYDEEWYITTHKKLNAFKSRWSCKDTFGEIFRKSLYEMFGSEAQTDDVLVEFYTQLDKEKIYLFLVRSNQENRIVCQTHYVKKNEKIVHVGSFDKEFKFTLNNGGDEGWVGRLCVPLSPPPFQTSDEMIEYINNVNHFEYQGLIFFDKNSSDQFKIVNPTYHQLYVLRDNNPNLRFRYLEIRNDPEKVKQLYTLYPRSADIFDEYENIIYKIARMIYHFYVNRYIKNRYITLPREEYLIMKKCHDWYLSDRQNNRIFTNKIKEFLAEEPPLNLYKMIRQFIANNNNQPIKNNHMNQTRIF